MINKVAPSTQNVSILMTFCFSSTHWIPVSREFLGTTSWEQSRGAFCILMSEGRGQKFTILSLALAGSLLDMKVMVNFCHDVKHMNCAPAAAATWWWKQLMDILILGEFQPILVLNSRVCGQGMKMNNSCILQHSETSCCFSSLLSPYCCSFFTIVSLFMGPEPHASSCARWMQFVAYKILNIHTSCGHDCIAFCLLSSYWVGMQFFLKKKARRIIELEKKELLPK